MINAIEIEDAIANTITNGVLNLGVPDDLFIQPDAHAVATRQKVFHSEHVVGGIGDQLPIFDPQVIVQESEETGIVEEICISKHGETPI